METIDGCLQDSNSYNDSCPILLLQDIDFLSLRLTMSQDHPRSFKWRCEIWFFPKGRSQLPPHPSQSASVHREPTLLFSTLWWLLGESLACVNWCLSLLKWPKSRTPMNTRCWRGHGPTRTVIHCWWGGKMVQVLWKIVGWFLTKLNKFLLDNLVTLFLVIYPKEVKVHPHKNRHTDVYSCFIIAKNGSNQGVPH